MLLLHDLGAATGELKKRLKGHEVWKGTHFHVVYAYVEAKVPVPEVLRHNILSRAHLP